MASKPVSIISAGMILYLLWNVQQTRAAALLSESATMPVHQGHFVRIYVGNPGKLLSLRLRWDLDQIYLYEPPQPYSDTYSNSYRAVDPKAKHSSIALQSDIFYIGSYKLRLPVIYGREATRREETNDGAIYHGSLGLARNSIIWHYWNRFTVSKYALILGDDRHLLDVHEDVFISDLFRSGYGTGTSTRNQRRRHYFHVQYLAAVPLSAQFELNPSETTIDASYKTLLNCSLAVSFPSIANKSTGEPATVYRMHMDLSQDYTYIPQKVLYELKHRGGPKQESLIALTLNGDAKPCTTATATPTSFTDQRFPLISIWISLLSNFFVNPYGSVNNLVEMAETKEDYPASITSLGTQENNNTVVILGRIMALERFVISMDLTQGIVTVANVFDAFPRLTTHPQTMLVLMCLLLWTWWHLETHPLKYHWARELVSKRGNLVAIVVSMIRKALIDRRRQNNTVGRTLAPDPHRVSTTTTTDARFRGTPSTSAAAAPDLQNNNGQPVEFENSIGVEATLIVQPYRTFDAESITAMLWLTRVVVFITVYLAVWGFDSSRFLERRFKSIHLEPEWAMLLHRAILVAISFASCITTASFMRRYPYTGTVLVDIVLFTCAWLNRIPAVCTNEISFVALLLISAIICACATEWLFSTYVRGCEWLNVHDFLERYQYVMTQLQNEYVSSALSPLSREYGLTQSRDAAPKEDNPFLTHMSELRADLASTTRQARLLLDHSIARGSVSWKAMFAWVILVLPIVWSFFFFGNLLPSLEFFFPMNPIQIELAWLFMWCTVVYFAFSRSTRLLIHLMNDSILKLKKKNLQQLQTQRVTAEKLATNKID